MQLKKTLCLIRNLFFTQLNELEKQWLFNFVSGNGDLKNVKSLLKKNSSLATKKVYFFPSTSLRLYSTKTVFQYLHCIMSLLFMFHDNSWN